MLIVVNGLVRALKHAAVKGGLRQQRADQLLRLDDANDAVWLRLSGELAAVCGGTLNAAPDGDSTYSTAHTLRVPCDRNGTKVKRADARTCDSLDQALNDYRGVCMCMFACCCGMAVITSSSSSRSREEGGWGTRMGSSGSCSCSSRSRSLGCLPPQHMHTEESLLLQFCPFVRACIAVHTSHLHPFALVAVHIPCTLLQVRSLLPIQLQLGHSES